MKFIRFVFICVVWLLLAPIMLKAYSMSIGDRVKMVASDIAVRDTKSTLGNNLGRLPLRQEGTIIDGPDAGNSYVWAKVSWDNGATGWTPNLKTKYYYYEQATLLSPGNLNSNYAEITDLTPTLRWQNIDGAINYWISVRDVDSGALVFNKNDVSGSNTSYTLPSGRILKGHRYYWNITVRDGDGDNSIWADSLYFKIIDEVNNIPIDTPELISVTPHSVIGTLSTRSIQIDGNNLLGTILQVAQGDGDFKTITSDDISITNEMIKFKYTLLAWKNNLNKYRFRVLKDNVVSNERIINTTYTPLAPLLVPLGEKVITVNSGENFTLKFFAFDLEDHFNNKSQYELYVKWGEHANFMYRRKDYLLTDRTHKFDTQKHKTYTVMAYAKDNDGQTSNRVSIKINVRGTNDSSPISKKVYANSTHYDNVAKQSPCGRKRNSNGRSIDKATGAENFSITPMVGHGLIDLPLTLQYNSTLLAGSSLGIGWSHNYSFTSYIENLDNDYLGKVRIHWDASNKKYNDFIYDKTIDDNRYYSSDELASLSDSLIRLVDDSYILERKNGTKYYYNNQKYLISIMNYKNQNINIDFDESGRIVKVEEPVSGIFLTYFYNSEGKLARVRDRLDRITYFKYTADGLLREIESPDGVIRHVFKYTDNNQLYNYKLVDSENNKIQYFDIDYDSNGKASFEEDGNNNTSQFFFNTTKEAGKIHSTYIDKSGKTTKTVYDDSNFNPYQISYADGTKEYFEYYANGKKKRYTDRAGNNTWYYYDANGNLNKVKYQDNSYETYTYDDRRNITFHKIYDKHGQQQAVTHNVYNADNTLQKTEQLDGLMTTYAYDNNNQVSTKTIDDKTTEYRYNAKGYLEKLETPEGLIAKYTYDNAGRLKTETNLQEGTTKYTYDVMDNIKIIENPAGKTKTFEYDFMGNKTKETDFNGNETTYKYDHNGNMLETKDAEGHIYTFEYDSADRLKKSIDPRQNFVAYTYDSMGRVSKTIDKNGNATTYAYDAMGNLRSQTDPYGHKLFTRTYDSKNRLIQSVNILNQKTLTDYTVFGKPSSVEDPTHRVTQFKYDKVGRLIEAINAKGNSATQHYYPTGELKDFIDANGNKTEFTYNDDGQLLATKTASGSTQTNVYNKGLLKIFKNAKNQTKSFTYDTLGRVKQAKDDDGTIVYTYDDNSNLLTITENGKMATYTHDGLNRVTSYTDIYGDTIRYDYDAVGNLERLTYPNSQDVEYSYDANGNMIEALVFGSKATKYSYDKNNRLIKITRPNGTILTRVYNSAGQLESQTDKTASGTVISSVVFTYYDNGTVHTETRIPEVKPQLPINLSMSYKQGNLLDTAKAKQTTFDDDDNMISIGADRYSYDSRNRLTSNGDTTSYGYDSQNHRISQTINGKQTTYTIDPIATLSQLLVMKESDGSKTTYIYGATGLLAQMKNGTTLYYHYDLRGSTIALTDENGNIVDRWSYLPFGGHMSHDVGTTQTPFLYNGRDGVQTDPSGLYYMRARYYDPGIRRFISRDTLLGELGDMATLNRFGYVNGNPVSGVDPLGLYGWSELAQHVSGSSDIVFGTIGTAVGGLLTIFGSGLNDLTGISAVENHARAFTDESLQTYTKGINNVISAVGADKSFLRDSSQRRNSINPTGKETYLDEIYGYVNLAKSGYNIYKSLDNIKGIKSNLNIINRKPNARSSELRDKFNYKGLKLTIQKLNEQGKIGKNLQDIGGDVAKAYLDTLCD